MGRGAEQEAGPPVGDAAAEQEAEPPSGGVASPVVFFIYKIFFFVFFFIFLYFPFCFFRRRCLLPHPFAFALPPISFLAAPTENGARSGSELLLQLRDCDPHLPALHTHLRCRRPLLHTLPPPVSTCCARTPRQTLSRSLP